MQFKRKIVNQTEKMTEKLILGPILAGFTSIGCYTLSQDIIVLKFKENLWSKLKKMAKNLIVGLTLIR